MAKLVKKKYYNKDGVEKVNNYFIYISKEILNQSKINENKELNIYALNGKIIIEEK